MSGFWRQPEIGIAVLERSPYRLPELQRAFVDQPAVIEPITEARAVDARLASFPNRLAVLEFAADPAGILWWLSRRHSRFPVIILGDPQTREMEWVLRELSADHFYPEWPSGPDFVRACARLLVGTLPQPTILSD